MKKNLGLKLLSGAVVLVVVLVITSQGGEKNTAAKTVNTNNLNEAIASQFNDNIRDVSARLQETEAKMQKIAQENQKMAERNQALETQKSEIASSADNSELRASLEALKQELSSLKTAKNEPAKSSADNAYPIGEKTASNDKTLQQPWVDIDAKLLKHPLTEDETHYWQALNARKKSLHPHQLAKAIKKPVKKRKTLPFYTLPAGSDFGRTALLSALIGEVPIDGKLMQPLFPFSAVISPGDLMASNGIMLPPDVAGMKISGYAIGVGSFLDNISCVRAYVTAALFTFQDGHFVTIGKERMSNATDLVNNDSLGYLTTPFGNPCIHGKYYTNAPQVLLAMMAAGGVQGVGNALSQWQMTYFAGGNGVTQAPTGSLGQYAAGGAIAEGGVKVADWLEKRIQGSFDMVFVPASAPIAKGGQFVPTQLSFHLTQTINLDKQLRGRVIDYGNLQARTHDFSLK